MTHIITRRTLLAGSGLAAAYAGLAGLPVARAATAPITGRKLKIALSNSFIGNKWRLTMENLFKAALLMEPYKSEVEGTWFNSGNDVSKQSQQLSNLISQGVDAILIDAASPTGLNGILKQASDRGILVVSFDNTVTEPSGLTISMDEFGFGVQWAEWLVKKLNGQGNVIMITGVAGTFDDEQRNKGADSVWAQEPRYQGGRPLHRQLGHGRDADKHRRDPAHSAENRWNLVPEQRRRVPEGVRRRQAHAAAAHGRHR